MNINFITPDEYEKAKKIYNSEVFIPNIIDTNQNISINLLSDDNSVFYNSEIVEKYSEFLKHFDKK